MMTKFRRCAGSQFGNSCRRLTVLTIRAAKEAGNLEIEVRNRRFRYISQLSPPFRLPPVKLTVTRTLGFFWGLVGDLHSSTAIPPMSLNGIEDTNPLAGQGPCPELCSSKQHMECLKNAPVGLLFHTPGGVAGRRRFDIPNLTALHTNLPILL